MKHWLKEAALNAITFPVALLIVGIAWVAVKSDELAQWIARHR